MGSRSGFGYFFAGLLSGHGSALSERALCRILADGPHAVDGWAKITNDDLVGDLSFSIAADNPTLFASPPTIDGTGKLTFTPAIRMSSSTTARMAIETPLQTLYAAPGVPRSAMRV